MPPRALLISLRDPADKMAWQERRCFADRADLPEDQVDMHSMADGRPGVDKLRRYDAVFFGGSGAYSVLDDVLWIKQGIELCLEVVGLRIPAYASCFGFQGLALAFGGRLGPVYSINSIGSHTGYEYGATTLDRIQVTGSRVGGGRYLQADVEFNESVRAVFDLQR